VVHEVSSLRLLLRQTRHLAVERVEYPVERDEGAAKKKEVRRVLSEGETGEEGEGE
jgi:hypothetical protein